MRGKTEENQIKLHFLSQPVEVELAFGFLCVSPFSAQIKGSRIYLGSWFQRVQSTIGQLNFFVSMVIE